MTDGIKYHLNRAGVLLSTTARAAVDTIGCADEPQRSVVACWQLLHALPLCIILGRSMLNS